MDPPDFVAEVPDDLLCLVCMHAVGVCGRAAVTVGCGHLFCQGCIDTWLQAGNATCPVDRLPLTRDDIRPDVRSQRRADALTVRCSAATAPARPASAEDVMSASSASATAPVPCTWTGAWSDLAAHERRCPAVAPRVHCPLRALGCATPSFGPQTDIAGVATRAAVHNAESVDAHIRLLATALIAERARNDELRAAVAGLTGTVAALQAAVSEGAQRGAAAAASAARRHEALLETELRALLDHLAVDAGRQQQQQQQQQSVSVSPVMPEAIVPVFDVADGGPEPVVAEPQQPSASSSPTAPTGAPPPSSSSSALTVVGVGGHRRGAVREYMARHFVRRVDTEGRALICPAGAGWSAAVASAARTPPKGFEFTVAVVQLGDRSGASADTSSCCDVMVGVTTNAGAPLHHGRRGHLGYIPGSIGLQGSGFLWSGGASSGWQPSGEPYLTFARGDAVTVRVLSDGARFTHVAFGVGGNWTKPIAAAGVLGAGPVLPVIAVLSPDVGFRIVAPPAS